ARAHRFAIIEDDYDHEFHYDGRPVLPLASADPGGVVVYIGTLSKVLAPALRIGCVVAPTPLIERIAAHRSFVDAQGDQVLEYAIAELLEDGEIRRHIPAESSGPGPFAAARPATSSLRSRQAPRSRAGPLSAAHHVYDPSSARARARFREPRPGRALGRRRLLARTPATGEVAALARPGHPQTRLRPAAKGARWAQSHRREPRSIRARAADRRADQPVARLS